MSYRPLSDYKAEESSVVQLVVARGQSLPSVRLALALVWGGIQIVLVPVLFALGLGLYYGVLIGAIRAVIGVLTAVLVLTIVMCSFLSLVPKRLTITEDAIGCWFSSYSYKDIRRLIIYISDQRDSSKPNCIIALEFTNGLKRRIAVRRENVVVDAIKRIARCEVEVR